MRWRTDVEPRVWRLGVVLVALCMGVAPAASAQPPPRYSLTPVGDSVFAGWAGRQLIEFAEVSIRRRNGAPVRRLACRGLSVRFRPFVGVPTNAGASAVPTRWQPNDCRARAAWVLRNEAGYQYLEATVMNGLVVASDPLTFRARARGLPRIVFGIALIRNEFEVDTLSLVRESGFDDSVTLDRARPVVGADFPILPSNVRIRFFERIRLMVGTSVTDPSREVFVGISLLPFLQGWPTEPPAPFVGSYSADTEDLPLAVILGARWQRLTFVDDMMVPIEDKWNRKFFIGLFTAGTAILGLLGGAFGGG